MSIMIKNLSKLYCENHLVLDGINLEIGENDFVCIMGPSGCGKSSLLNIIAGFECPSEGSILEDNKKITGPSRDRVLMVQDGGLFPWLNLEENIRFGLKQKHIKKSMHRDIVGYFLKIMALEGYRNYRVCELSGGMRQRGALARTLASGGKYVLLDEPFSAVDVPLKKKLYREVVSIWKEKSNSIICVTHDIDEALLMAKRIVILSPAPSQIRKIIDIPMGWPRNTHSSEFILFRTMVMNALNYDGGNNYE